MRKTLLSLFFCAVIICGAGRQAQAQVPGYMGKRFSLHYDPQFMYAFLAGHFDVHHNASVEYVSSLRTAVGFRYGFSNLKDEFEYQQRIVGPNGSYYEDMETEIRDKIHSFAVYAKLFSKRKGFIAPAGPYTSWGMSVLLGKATVAEDGVIDEEFLEKGDKLTSAFSYALYVGRGRQFIVADRIILNIGAQLGIPLIWNLGGTDQETELSTRMGLSYIFRAEIGIGLLAF